MIVVRMLDGGLQYAAKIVAAFVTLGFSLALAVAPITLGIALATCAAQGMRECLGVARWAEGVAFLGALGLYGWYVAPLIRTDAAIGALNEK